MIGRCVLVGAAVVAAGIFAVAASPAAGQVSVSIYGCALNSGAEFDVPAGADVVLTAGWVAKNRGLVQAFLNDQQLSLSVNGVPVADTASSFGPIAPYTGGGDVTRFAYDLGRVTAPTTLSVDEALSHQLPDGITTTDAGKPLHFSGTVFAGSCTIVPV